VGHDDRGRPLVDRRGLVSGIDALDRSSFVGGASIYPFVQNVLLASRAEGLGAALTMPLNNEDAEVKREAALGRLSLPAVPLAD